MRKTKGITLIALVITIIVLLILAGVSISMISGDDGIISRASEASEKTKQGTEEELEKLEESKNYIDQKVNGTVSGEVVKYIVTFSYKNSSGVTVTENIEVESGKNVTTTPSVPASYTSGGTKYTFANKWVTTEGGATEASLENITANKTVYAVYNTSVVCFVEGTEVLTENGLIDIEDIKVGMKVYSYNELTGEVELKDVKNAFVNYVDYDMTKVTVNGEIIESTSGHEYYEITKGWVDACDLKVGDKILNNNNEEVEIQDVEIKEFEGNELIKVYNFEVEDNHNYYVGENNVLVHNVVVHGSGENC